MFPKTSTTTQQQNIANSVISDSKKIRKTPNFSFEKNAILLKNGDAEMIDDIQNVKNWIATFIKTPIDILPIYEGTGFGTSAYKMRGSKQITGMQYAQLKKEIEEGFKLNPNILKTENITIEKDEKTLAIGVTVYLKNGNILKEKFETWSI